MAINTAYRIERTSLAAASPELMRQLVALVRIENAEQRPEDPPERDAAIEAEFRTTSPLFIRSEWAAFAGSELVGFAGFVENRTGSNAHIREVRLTVHPAHRRRGVATAIFGAGVKEIRDDAARLLEWWTTTRVPSGEAFSRRLGAKRCLHMRVSQVDLATLDRDLMRRWASIDPAGYRLERNAGDIPERLLPAAIDAFNAINRMPKEDLDAEDWIFNEHTIRDWERIRKARGRQQLLIVATQEATGAAAGFTDVVFDPLSPTVIHQGGTAVDPAHQGKSLGKWMKAAMAEWILRDVPGARYIRTDNAGTNAKMLSINDRMGFQEAWWGDVWQLPIEAARAYAERAR